MTVNLSNALTDKSAAVRWMKFTCMLPSLALDTRVKTGQTESDGTRTHIDLPSSFRPVNHFATFSIPRLPDKKYPSVILWFCCVCVRACICVWERARARAHTRVSFLFILPSFCCCSEITVRCGRDVKIQNLTSSFVVVVFFSPLFDFFGFNYPCVLVHLVFFLLISSFQSFRNFSFITPTSFVRFFLSFSKLCLCDVFRALIKSRAC